MDPNPWDGWLPTPAHLNALPDPVRRYIHDLETRCDPAGELRELVIARETCQALQRRVAELDAALAERGDPR